MLYRSAGVGARIFMPAFGLMGIDWGYGFDQSQIAAKGQRGAVPLLDWATIQVICCI